MNFWNGFSGFFNSEVFGVFCAVCLCGIVAIIVISAIFIVANGKEIR